MQQKTPKKNKKLRKQIDSFQRMFPVCRIVSKTLGSPLCSQNLCFLVKIEGGSDENNLEKSRIVPKKTPVLKTRNAISGIRKIRNFLYAVCVKSRMDYVFVEGDSLAPFTALKNSRNIISGYVTSLFVTL